MKKHQCSTVAHNVIANRARPEGMKMGTKIDTALRLSDGLDGNRVFSEELLKLATMTPAQQFLVKCGECPKCGTKTLKHKNEGAGMQFDQCKSCFSVWILPSNAKSN